jgi:hypothetical protein
MCCSYRHLGFEKPAPHQDCRRGEEKKGLKKFSLEREPELAEESLIVECSDTISESRDSDVK